MVEAVAKPTVFKPDAVVRVILIEVTMFNFYSLVFHTSHNRQCIDWPTNVAVHNQRSRRQKRPLAACNKGKQNYSQK